MKAKSAIIAAVASVGIAGGAYADSLYVDLTGFQSNLGWPGFGSSTTVNIGAGSTITNIEFTNITIEAFSPSWGSEMAFGVADATPFTSPYWESQVPGTADAPGVYGPITANFDNPGLYNSTEGWVASTGMLVVYVYELFNDGSVDPDAIVLSGGITIHYTPIPAPGALALLGLAGAVGGRRRRRA